MVHAGELEQACLHFFTLGDVAQHEQNGRLAIELRGHCRDFGGHRRPVGAYQAELDSGSVVHAGGCSLQELLECETILRVHEIRYWRAHEVRLALHPQASHQSRIAEHETSVPVYTDAVGRVLDERAEARFGALDGRSSFRRAEISSSRRAA